MQIFFKFINYLNFTIMDDSKVFMFPDSGTKQTSEVNSLLPLLMMSNGGMNGGG